MIRIKTSTWGEFSKTGGEPVALFAFEDSGLAADAVPEAARKDIWRKAGEQAFKGKTGECAAVSASDGVRERTFILAGLGKRGDLRGEGLRKAAGSLAKFSRKKHKSIAVLPEGDPQAVGEGLILASYRFEEYRKPEEDSILAEAVLLAPRPAGRKKLDEAARRAALYAEAVCMTRDLVNRGPSDKSPEAMGKLAQGLSGNGVSVHLIGPEEAAKLGMGSFLSVARGSSLPPCLVHLAYRPKGAKRKAGLVGKGITFDSGGLSLKPPQSMEEMKMDMAGAAIILSIFKVLPRLGVKTEVHGFCAFTYNMPGPDATKPGDVARAMNGKTIEILNTDAEGRLVLADALVYATKKGVESIVDFATLTGAALIALGGRVTAAMANDRALLARVQAAAKKADEALWELPLFAEYKEHIKSSVADLRNISKVRGEAGTIIGGLFLQEFVGDTPWVHLDIAGPAWTHSDTEYCHAGGTGAMVRTTLDYLASL